MIPSPHGPPPPSLPSRPSKVEMQRQYREREGMYFSQLRDIIKELTGEELQTRQEILTKVIDLLLTVLKTRKQREAPVVPTASWETPSTNNSADTTLGHLDYPAQWQLFHFPQTLRSHVEFDAYTTQLQGRQYHFNADPVLNRDNYQEYGEEWPGPNHPLL